MINLRKTPEPGLIRSFSMLLVEDDKVAEAKIHRECDPVLNNDEFTTEVVLEKTVDAGWARAEVQLFNIYVIDWHTPGEKEGPALIEEILRKNPTARIVFYTSANEHEIDETGLRGRVEVILKEPKQLRVVLERWLRELKEALYRRKNSENANKE